MKRKRFKHSILFGNGSLKNGQFKGLDTYEDFHLIPSSRPTVSMPGVETKFVTIPGRDGSVDLSSFLRGDRPAFGDRTGTWEFKVENDFDVDANDEEFWMTIYPRLLNELHGKKFKMVLREDDPDYYWEGRVTVDKYEPGDGSHSEVSISYAVSPFKRNIRKVSEGMLWDNFNFEKDHDHAPMNLEDISLTGSQKTFTLWCEGYPFIPELRVLSSAGSQARFYATFGGKSIKMDGNGTIMTDDPNYSTSLGHAVYGENILTLNGQGRMSVDWRGGSL